MAAPFSDWLMCNGLASSAAPRMDARSFQLQPEDFCALSLTRLLAGHDNSEKCERTRLWWGGVSVVVETVDGGRCANDVSRFFLVRDDITAPSRKGMPQLVPDRCS